MQVPDSNGSVHEMWPSAAEVPDMTRRHKEDSERGYKAAMATATFGKVRSGYA